MNAINTMGTKLDQITYKLNDDISLLKGKTGVALCYFLLFHFNKDISFRKKGEFFFQNVCDSIYDVDNLTFFSGLSGIGWGIEFISQHFLINFNSDPILCDVDDLLYKSVSFKKTKTISLNKGIMGNAFYFLMRFTTTNPNVLPYRGLINKECLVFIASEIDSFLNNINLKTTSDDIILTKDAIEDLAICFVLFYFMKNSKVIEKILYPVLITLKDYFESLFISTLNVCSDLCSIWSAYAFISRMSNNHNMIENAKLWYDSYFSEKLKRTSISEKIVMMQVAESILKTKCKMDYSSMELPDMILCLLIKYFLNLNENKINVYRILSTMEN